jgi:hypothetical protein
VVDNPPSRNEYLQNMELKLTDNDFLNDITLLLRADEQYHSQEAWNLVREKLVERL